MIPKEELDLIARLNKIGVSLSKKGLNSEKFDLILDTAMNYTNADGGTLYFVKDNKLKFEIVKNISLGIHLNNNIKWPEIKLYNEDFTPRINSTVGCVFHERKSLNIDDIYQQDRFDISKTKEIDAQNKYRTKSILAIPMIDHEKKVIGIIQLINALDDNHNVISFKKKHQALLESLSSQVSIMISNDLLISQLKGLLFSSLKAVAKAIDLKSKWTSKHIERVTILTKMISEKINESNEFYSKISFSKAEMEELELAALMHDIGKIVTPDKVLNKNKKLFPAKLSIEIIELRFRLMKEILKRKISSHEIKKNSKEAQLLEKLDSYFELILNVNDSKISNYSTYEKTLREIKEVYFEFEGKKYFLINEEEFKNLSIKHGTLTNEELDIIRNHVVQTRRILSGIKFPERYKNIDFYAATHHEKLDGKGYPDGLTAEKLPLQSRIIAFADIFEALTASDRVYREPNTIQEALQILAYMVKSGGLDRHIMDLIMSSELYLEYGVENLKQSQIVEVDKDKIKRIYHA